MSKLDLGPTQPPAQWILGAVTMGVEWPGHYTKRVFITQELRSTIIYQQPLKIYLVIRINSN